MHAVVVFESMFGNTRRVAEAVAIGLRERCEVRLVPARDVDPAELVDAELVVIGAPTHMHGLSRPASRDASREQAAKSHGAMRFEPAADGPGVREALATLTVLNGNAAAFDTRLRGPGVLTGRASRAIERRLRRCGAQLVAPAQSFFVDRDNELRPGELDRARDWGVQLGARTSTFARAGGTPDLHRFQQRT